MLGLPVAAPKRRAGNHRVFKMISYSALGLSLAKLFPVLDRVIRDKLPERATVGYVPGQGGSGLGGKLPVHSTEWVQCEPDCVPISHQRALCVGQGCAGSLASNVAKLVTTHGFGADVCNNLKTAIANIALAPQDWIFLFVDIDGLEREADLEEVVGDLKLLRLSLPAVVVLVCSSRDMPGRYGGLIANILLQPPVTAEKVIRSFPLAHGIKAFG